MAPGAVSLGLTELLASAPLQTLSLRGFLGDGLGSSLARRLLAAPLRSLDLERCGLGASAAARLGADRTKASTKAS